MACPDIFFLQATLSENLFWDNARLQQKLTKFIHGILSRDFSWKPLISETCDELL